MELPDEIWKKILEYADDNEFFRLRNAHLMHKLKLQNKKLTKLSQLVINYHRSISMVQNAVPIIRGDNITRIHLNQITIDEIIEVDNE
jgi:hypothetical protein